MEIFQKIMVLLIFLAAVGYLITKFIYTPSFLKKKDDNGCGNSSCGC
ncbi:hypothetical protein [uncultured Dokdonia sp.]|nr:hypothetical protein [uncultured Dokdonia sp.]